MNLSDNQISSDHYDFKCARVPECSSKALNYYSHHGLCVHSYSDLKLRLKKDLQRGISPILIHFSYRPSSGDCLKEAQRAFSEEHLSGNHRLYYHPTAFITNLGKSLTILRSRMRQVYANGHRMRFHKSFSCRCKAATSSASIGMHSL